MKKLITLIALSLTMILCYAQEGMWMLTQIGQLDLKSKGLQIDPGMIYNPEGKSLSMAIVQLGGGTASFVSPDGLLLTNHHVAFGALQRTSSVSSDYLTQGFLAGTREKEIPAPGYVARMVIGIKDVTQEVLDAVKGITDPVERDRKVGMKYAEISDAIENGKEDIQAVVTTNFHGKQYIAYTYKLIKDIRIVYAPPMAIGNYGGEIDNWMWPRHTGDFSFLRAYVAPDGTGSEYSEGNIPYRPDVWLKVAQTDLDEGDFTFVVGFPGFTTRYRTSNSAAWNLEQNYPFSIRNFQEIIDMAEFLTKDDPAGQIKVAALTKGLANVKKNYQGKVDGMKRTHFVEKRIAYEKEFLVWANSNPSTKEKYGKIFEMDHALYDELLKTKDRDNVYGLFQGLAGLPLASAIQIYAVAAEKEKPEAERQPGFNEETVQEFIDGMEFQYMNYYEPMEKELMARALKMAAALPEGQRIGGVEKIVNNPSESIDQFVDKSFKASKLMDLEYARTLPLKTTKELAALNDPFINMAIDLYPLSVESGEAYEKFAANVSELRKLFIEGIYEWKGAKLYPDANGTIRFSWGHVKGYVPQEAALYYPFTTLKGVVAKNTGDEPFNAPQGLIDLYNTKDFGRWVDPDLSQVPVAFLSEQDITGGNSGSPIMNAKGEIVGVVFDGNYEAMISDWSYDYELQRTISVDIRYVLFVTEKFGKAGSILKEMGIQ